MTHRLTIQFDAKLWFDLNLPHDDQSLIANQTPLSVIVSQSDDAGSCGNHVLKLRVGHGHQAIDYVQAEFVHRSAAEGAAKCLLQYLTSKKLLNVEAEMVSLGDTPLPAADKQTFVAVGWSMAKVDADPTHPRGCDPVQSQSGRVALEPT